jgi:hypothetical protein
MLTIAVHCKDESRKAGATDAQYKAGIQLVKEALADMSRVDARQIEVTKHESYRVWWRLKMKNAPAVSYRVIVEITGQEVIVHVVLPRSSSTYDEVEKLWKTHRKSTSIDTDE